MPTAQFYKQVSTSEKVVCWLEKISGEDIKLTGSRLYLHRHLLCCAASDHKLYALYGGSNALALYLLLIFRMPCSRTKVCGLPCYLPPSALIQLFGYGIGFLKERIRRVEYFMYLV